MEDKEGTERGREGRRGSEGRRGEERREKEGKRTGNTTKEEIEEKEDDV